MKRFILLLVAIFIVKLATAQQVETGIRFNYNVSDWHGEVWQGVSDITKQTSDIASLQNRKGFSAGVYTLLPLNSYLNLESGIYYDQKGTGVRVRPFESFLSPEVKTTVKLNYLTVPLNLNVEILEGLFLTGGASISYLLNSQLGVRGSWLGIGVGDSFPIKNAFNDWDFNLRGGVMYQFDNGFQLRTEYSHGLSRINGGIIGADVYNKGLSMGIGFKF